MREDLTGNKYGKLTVLEMIENGSCRCICECGNEKNVKSYNLKNGHTKSCGCAVKKQSAINGLKHLQDLSGKRFGKLVAKSYDKKLKKWLCICDCGKSCYVSQNNLQRKEKATKSCGCLVSLDTANESNLIDGTNVGSIKNLGLSARNQTGVRGVYFEKSSGMYVANIGFQGKQYILKKSTNFEACVEARKKAESKIFGEFLEWYENECEKDNE